MNHLRNTIANTNFHYDSPCIRVLHGQATGEGMEGARRILWFVMFL